MANHEASLWKFSRGAFVLLNYKDRITAEPSMSFGKNVQVELLSRALEVAIFDRGGSEVTLSFERITKHLTATAAREWRLEHMAALALMEKGDITMDLVGGQTYLLKDAVVRAGQSASGLAVSNTDAKKASMNYEIVASKIITPGPIGAPWEQQATNWEDWG